MKSIKDRVWTTIERETFAALNNGPLNEDLYEIWANDFGELWIPFDHQSVITTIEELRGYYLP